MKNEVNRCYGTGTIFKLSNGYWRSEFNWTDEYGNKQRICWTSKNKNDAKKKLESFKLNLHLQKEEPTNNDITFEDFSKHWLEVYKPKVKKLSYVRKESSIKNQVIPNIGKEKMFGMRFSVIQKMINRLFKQGYSYSTIKKAYEAANSCYRYFRVENKLSYNPFEGIVLPSSNEKDISNIRFFDKEEREKIITEARRTYKNGVRVYKYGDAFILLMYSGMRVGELCALKWEDVDFKNRTITISKNAIVLGHNEGSIMTQYSTKTKSGNRIIPMSEKAYGALVNLEKLSSGKEYIMTSRRNNRIRPNNLTVRFKNLLKSIGIEPCGVHSLRHTFASMLFKNGCDIKTVSDILGHSNTKITENIYVHLTQEQRVKAIETIDKYSD